MSFNFKLSRNITINNILVFLSFILFTNNYIYADTCNDLSALNYNSESNSDVDCVYFNMPSQLETDEDTPLEVYLLSYAQGPSHLINNIEFNINCSDLLNIQSCSIVGSVFNIVFNDNFDSTSQELSLTYQYNEEFGGYAYFNIRVNPINDYPQIIVSDDIDLQSSIGNLFQYTILVDDPDNNNFSFELIDNPFGASIINYSSLAVVSYTPSANDSFISCPGSTDQCFKFEIQASDNGVPNGIDTDIFFVKVVDAVIDSPQLDLAIITDEFDRLEDSSISVGINVTNDDNFLSGNLNVIAIYSRPLLEPPQYIHQSQNVIVDQSGNYDFKSNFMTLSDWNGTFLIKVIADNSFGSTVEEFEINLTSVNDEPSVDGLQGVAYNEGNCSQDSNCLHYAGINDPDQDEFKNEFPIDYADLEYTLEWYGQDEQISGGTQNIMSSFERQGSNNYVVNYYYINDENWYGTEYFKIVVDDGIDNNQAIFPVTISNINDPPNILDEPEDQEISEDGELNFSINVGDIDSDPAFFNYFIEGDYIDYNVSENGEITIIPNHHYYGSTNIYIQVNDDQDLFDSSEFVLTVNPVNDNPLTKDLNIYLNEDGTKYINLNGASDLCNQLVSDNSAGSIICACDSDSFVGGACDIEDATLYYKLSASTANGILSLDDNSLVNIGDSLNGSVIIYTPNDNYFGADSFSYEVCDSEDACSNGLVSIIVEHVNDLPVAENMTIPLYEDEQIQIPLIATDIENDQLTYQISDSPDYGSYQLQNNTFFYTPNINYYGSDQFSFSVTDDGGVNLIEATYMLDIASVNDSPMLSELENVNFNEGSTGTLLLSATDVDNEELTFSITDGVDITSILDVNTNTITFETSENYNGNEDFTIMVSDGDLIDEQIITVIINAVNDQPEILSIKNSLDINCIENTCSFNEDELFNLAIDSFDIDNDPLVYYILDENNFSIEDDGQENDNEFSFIANLHYYGVIEIPIKVCDEGITNGILDPLCVEQSITVNINSVNDLPRAKRMIVFANEECTEEININLFESSCSQSIMDGILCDCDNSDSFTSGICDIESSDMTYEIVSGPNHGTVEILNGIINYTPLVDYISEDVPDIIQYRVIDSDSQSNEEVILDSKNECIDLDNCPFIDITVQELNDSPIVNCPNELINGECEISLTSLISLYEDCSPDENSDNSQCETVDGISIDDLRLGFSNENENICSQQHLWHDADCVDLEDSNPFSYGVAVDVNFAIENNLNKGIWKYRKQHEDNFRSFDLDGNCNFKLLDQNDQVKFYPNSNYYTTDNLESLPEMKFYAWDKTEFQNALNGCVDVMSRIENSCENSTSFSENAITGTIEIVSVNDSPVSVEIPDYEMSEFCLVDENPDCGLELHEILIDFSDPNDFNESYYSDNLYYLVSSKTISENNQQSLFSNILLNDNFLDLSNLVNENLEFNQEIIKEKDDGVYLQLKLTDYANGQAEVTIYVFDRENLEESLFSKRTFTVTVNQVNNKIKQFSLIPNIYNYQEYETNSHMIFPYNPAEEDNLYIKYPPYRYDNEIITIDDITADNFHSISDYMLEYPYGIDELYFMWERSFENDFLDYDIDPMLNANPYNLYFRLEFIDAEGQIYVLKDSINDSFSGFDKAFISVEFGDKEYKTYISGDIYNPQTNQKDKLDITGITPYNWRIVGDNYIDGDFDSEYDFQNTATDWSDNQYLINLHIPDLEYNFILNDIYTNYFDLFINPIPTNSTGIEYYENISFNQNSEAYLNYYGNGIIDDEIIVLESMQFQSELVAEQNIFRAYDDFNEYGQLAFLVPLQNEVETLKLDVKSLIYEKIEPNTFNELNSPTNQFELEFVSNNQFNILMHEKTKGDIYIDDESIDIISDLLILDANSNYLLSDMKIKFNLASNITFDSNLVFGKYVDGKIEELNSYIHNNVLIADINEFGSFLVVSKDNNTFNDEIPYETEIISCYPNPFNPFSNINYNLDNDNYVKFEIYNTLGQIVFESHNFYAKKGMNQYRWTGNDSYGNSLSSGVYLITMKTNNNVYSQKITLLK